MNITKYKERKQEYDLDLKTKMPKCMINASFHRLKFRPIDLMINKRVDGQPLTCKAKMSLLTSEFELIFCIKVLGICLIFPTKQEWAHLDFYNSRYISNTEQCLGRKTDSDFSFVYDLNSKTTLLNLGLFIKVLSLCLSFLSI